jgi:hypothetical protein
MKDIEMEIQESIILGFSSSLNFLTPQDLEKVTAACYKIHKQEIDKMYSERQLEAAYCIGVINQDDLTMDKLAEQSKTMKDKFELVKEFVKQIDKTYCDKFIQQNNLEWIKCSNMLPALNQHVDIIFDGHRRGTDYKYEGDGMFYNNEYDKTYSVGKVTHWMPLSPLPTKE